MESIFILYCIYAFANKLGVQNFTEIICVMQGRLASFEPRRQVESWHHIKLKKKKEILDHLIYGHIYCFSHHLISLG